MLIEWTDTKTSNATFEGAAREMLRVQLNTRIHPLGDVTFNPAARRGDSDWRVLYVACGDGGAGESSRPDTRSNPQRLDTLVGKILRIIPEPAERQSTSTLSDNGRYRIPNDNPFVSKPGARKEIWAYGLRNPHRLTWGSDPASPSSARLIANSIGLRTWETVNIIHKGANYGYSLREGNEMLQSDNKTTKLPEVDKVPLQISDTVSDGVMTPTYPVIQYPHLPGGGDAVGSGYLYRGKAIPALRGKYVFTDISTGRLWYADYKEMLAADDGNPATLAAMHELQHRAGTIPTTRPMPAHASTRRCIRSRRRRITSVAGKIRTCRAGPPCRATAARTRTSPWTRQASSISSARPTACSASSSLSNTPLLFVHQSLTRNGCTKNRTRLLKDASRLRLNSIMERSNATKEAAAL